jgi:hypothetical protein
MEKNEWKNGGTHRTRFTKRWVEIVQPTYKTALPEG